MISMHVLSEITRQFFKFFCNVFKILFQGMSKQRNFGEIKFKVCASEKLAREQLKKHGVEHYWDLAYSDLIMD